MLVAHETWGLVALRPCALLALAAVCANGLDTQAEFCGVELRRTGRPLIAMAALVVLSNVNDLKAAVVLPLASEQVCLTL